MTARSLPRDLSELSDLRDSTTASDLAVRFFHLEKSLPLASAQRSAAEAEAVNALVAGLPSADYRAVRAGLEDETRTAGEQLARDPSLREAFAALPLTGEDRVVLLGDSITDDLCSWGHLLSAALAVHRPGAVVVNNGWTGSTTQEAVSRFELVAAARPTWVLQMLGTNDVRRHGRLRVPTTSTHESARDLRALEEMVASVPGARHVVLTPPPVDGQLAASWPGFQAEVISWDGEDLDGLVAVIREQASAPLIDVHRALADLDPARWLLPDGVHPSRGGQRLIAEVVVRGLAALH